MSGSLAKNKTPWRVPPCMNISERIDASPVSARGVIHPMCGKAPVGVLEINVLLFS